MRALVLALLLGPSIVANTLATLDGVWLSRGWGMAFVVKGASLRAFEVTHATCVPIFTATRRQSDGGPGRSVFRRPDGGKLAFVSTQDGELRKVEDPAKLAVFLVERAPELPRACRSPMANTPLVNFEVFTTTFAEHYIAFDRRDVDWERRVEAARRVVTPQTTDSQLFDIFSGLLRPLSDIHTGLEAPNLKRSLDVSLKPGSDRFVRGTWDEFEKIGRAKLSSVTDRAYLQGRIQSLCNGQWKFGWTEGGIGYLRILAFGGYSRRGRYDANLQALHSALDQVLGDRRLKSLIVDLRLSFGGDDRLGLAIASRLSGEQYVAYEISARSDAQMRGRFTSPQSVHVKPGRQPLFTGPIVVLTSPFTMSAAETFVLALMQRTPRTIRIGESTQGVFCDPLERHLPNGWTFALPNAVYRTASGETFDVKGIPADIPVSSFAPHDLAAGRDPAMATALKLLTERQVSGKE